jgi:pimeloyl-ACP methyl ester carboxylesterase
MSDDIAAPLLFLPGLLCDGRVWAQQARAFGSRDPVVIDGYGFADRLDKMARVALDRAPSTFSLVGHSMGARVALEIYRLVPERVERLALLDTGVHPPSAQEARKRHALLALGRAEGIDRLVDEWLPPMVGPAARRDPELMAELKAMSVKGGTERYAVQIEALLHRPDYRQMLAAIRCPTLVGVGRQDEWSPVEQHEEIAAAIPGSELVIFEDCGHMAPVEAPDQVNLALERWLAVEPVRPVLAVS